ncbi:hypothetical protein [Streptosporangium subroseum]|nr:hypothetical protein OHB15_42565 [Streptosporangium subroseum]
MRSPRCSGVFPALTKVELGEVDAALVHKTDVLTKAGFEAP